MSRHKQINMRQTRREADKRWNDLVHPAGPTLEPESRSQRESQTRLAGLPDLDCVSLTA